MGRFECVYVLQRRISYGVWEFSIFLMFAIPKMQIRLTEYSASITQLGM